jgi:ankyrin repeat protein
MYYIVEEGAITNKNTEIVKLLIDNGADINKEDGSLGWRPIHYACIYEIEIIILYLIDYNVNVNMQLIIQLNGLNFKKQSALHLALSKNKENSTRLLLSTQKIDINLVDEYNQTALIKGCSTNSDNSCMLLLEHPELDVNTQDIHGNSALHYTMVR